MSSISLGFEFKKGTQGLVLQLKVGIYNLGQERVKTLYLLIVQKQVLENTVTEFKFKLLNGFIF